MHDANPESIAADASLLIWKPSRVRRGFTVDGAEWIADYVGTRASFRCGVVRRELLTHEQVDAICAVMDVTEFFDVPKAIVAAIGGL